jgi:hypothetical protein
MSIPLTAIEDIIDASGAAGPIEALLPHGVRCRQLTTRTLLTGMMLTLDDGRPAQLTRVHAALTGLPEAGQIRLGVLAQWQTGPHQLTYRQAGHTFRLIVKALGKDKPDGAPPAGLQAACDSLLEASIPARFKDTSSALAADWTDVETWSRPPRHGTSQCADPEASWGHRTSNLPGPRGEMFFGYYLSAAAMAAEENGQPVPELARRMTVCSCHLDPARALVPVLTAMPAPGPSRYGRPAPSWSRTSTRTTAAPAALTTAPSSPTETSTAPRHHRPCCSSARYRPAPPASRPPSTTSRPPSWPGTSSAGTPPTTPTATTASPAPPPAARSAARSARHP